SVLLLLCVGVKATIGESFVLLYCRLSYIFIVCVPMDRRESTSIWSQVQCLNQQHDHISRWASYRFKGWQAINQ
uniref:Uncharacterized protein n=1 Tax=Romanomermis culicivorax TaxID=13658 RepID=A0A915KP81_ROMCU